MFALQTLWVSLRTAVSEAVLRRRVMDELAALTDSDLSDMGISRCDIRRVAHETVEERRASRTRAPGRSPALTGSAYPA